MEDFVRMVSPQYVVISSGKNNRYGHPHKEVLDIFKKLNIEILRTDEMGTVEIDSDGVGVSAR
jgi:competence protein ComEC